jgi:hypothetical protein
MIDIHGGQHKILDELLTKADDYEQTLHVINFYLDELLCRAKQQIIPNYEKMTNDQIIAALDEEQQIITSQSSFNQSAEITEVINSLDMKTIYSYLNMSEGIAYEKIESLIKAFINLVKDQNTKIEGLKDMVKVQNIKIERLNDKVNELDNEVMGQKKAKEDLQKSNSDLKFQMVKLESSDESKQKVMYQMVLARSITDMLLKRLFKVSILSGNEEEVYLNSDEFIKLGQNRRKKSSGSWYLPDM